MALVKNTCLHPLQALIHRFGIRFFSAVREQPRENWPAFTGRAHTF